MAFHHATGPVPGHYADSTFAATEANRAVTVMTTALGAIVSLALLVGGAVWSYQLILRDVSGVPVVRAMTGPVRELPADPGGLAADHQGLAVNTIAAEGVAAPTPDALTLAPAPVDLTAEDVAQADLAARATPHTGTDSAVTDQVAAMVAELTRVATPLAALPPPNPPPAAMQAGVQAGVQAGARDGTGLTRAAAPSPEQAQPELAPAVTARSLRPRERPPGLGRSAAAPAAAASAAVVTIDPDTIAPGTRLAQLGAFESAAVAAREWDRLVGRFGDYLADKARVIQEAQSGGRTFFRLRAHGFADLDAARRFCAALVAERAECIPVVTR